MLYTQGFAYLVFVLLSQRIVVSACLLFCSRMMCLLLSVVCGFSSVDRLKVICVVRFIGLTRFLFGVFACWIRGLWFVIVHFAVPCFLSLGSLLTHITPNHGVV